MREAAASQMATFPPGLPRHVVEALKRLRRDVRGVFGPRPLRHLVEEHLGLILDLRALGGRWSQISALLSECGLRSPTGAPIGPDSLRAMVSRASRGGSRDRGRHPDQPRESDETIRNEAKRLAIKLNETRHNEIDPNDPERNEIGRERLKQPGSNHIEAQHTEMREALPPRHPPAARLAEHDGVGRRAALINRPLKSAR